jgi:heme exporter protein D
MAFWGFAVIALVVLIFVVVYRWILERRKRLWQVARSKARWEDCTTSANGKSMVVVRKVARVGRQIVVLDQHFVGSVAWDRDDYVAELIQLELEARTRAVQLNAGAVT